MLVFKPFPDTVINTQVLKRIIKLLLLSKLAIILFHSLSEYSLLDDSYVEFTKKSKKNYQDSLRSVYFGDLVIFKSERFELEILNLAGY